jgi:hypothetical protein
LTAALLLADLTRQGFRLDACDDGIGVVPASKLTDAQRLEIRENKDELLALLRAGKPSTAKVRARRRKTRAALPKPAPQCGPLPAPKPPPREPTLCAKCRPYGYPFLCQQCELDNDPGLELIGSFLFRTRRSVMVEPGFPWFRILVDQ